MDGLRWLLLFFGLLVIVGVYWYSRRERQRAGTGGKARAAKRVEPSFESAAESSFESAAESDAAAAATESEAGGPGGEPAAAPKRKEKIVTLRVVAKHRGTFPGDELALTLRGIGMRHGRFGIFHRYDGDDENKIIFSAASLVEPGSFDLANLKEQRIPGISLFLVLPGSLEGTQAYDLMVAAGRAVSKSLNAELLDESGSTFSIQRERFLREEIIQYQHGINLDVAEAVR
ncbi:MAG TPA: cell division protein ZipA C-terminal FtsZ-binding domain-containing protein [Woeseiaceae bacterium]|nr:cell division protein ZipA C-terminal FtsZ-binding domain-containing protein [Woeseiaceae bacterium]